MFSHLPFRQASTVVLRGLVLGVHHVAVFLLRLSLGLLARYVFGKVAENVQFFLVLRLLLFDHFLVPIFIVAPFFN